MATLGGERQSGYIRWYVPQSKEAFKIFDELAVMLGLNFTILLWGESKRTEFLVMKGSPNFVVSPTNPRTPKTAEYLNFPVAE